MVRHRRSAALRPGPPVTAGSPIANAGFEILPAAPNLATYIRGYWFIRDLDGHYDGRAVRTAPHPGAALSINIAKPNRLEGITPAPSLSLAGIQTQCRTWIASDETYFVMAMLTLPGLAALFPGTGAAAANGLVDLEGDLGHRVTESLTRSVAAGWDPAAIKPILDAWLSERLRTLPFDTAAYRAIRAYPRLKTANVGETAQRMGVSRRQLTRWFRDSIGIGPKALQDLERVSDSLWAVQSGGDAAEGYYDQSHQIRAWRRHTGTTPVRYRFAGPSDIAAHFAERYGKHTPFYL